MHTQSTTARFAALDPDQQHEARALRDELLRCRDLAANVDGAGLGTLALDLLPELAAFAQAWDEHAAALRAPAARPAPTPEPAPTKRSAWARACDKAELYLQTGASVVPAAGGAYYLVASASRASVVHRVDRDGQCTCEAGLTGKPCWHAAAAYLVGQGEGVAA